MTDAAPMKAAELFDLTGEVALVTGASSGLGKRFARVLAANGAAVALVARRRDRLEELAKEIVAGGGRAIAIGADVGDAEQMKAAFNAAEAALGVVTILVNNAGIARASTMIKDDVQSWRETMEINVEAVRANAVEAAQRMIKAGKGGSIINLASILSFGVGRSNGAYSVSKAAVMQLTKVFGFEFARYGIRANALAPGYFSTEMNADWLAGGGAEMMKHIPMRRFGSEANSTARCCCSQRRAESYHRRDLCR
ncbi:MAG: SDR family NAD(P)-dependent oxidoreductase [Methylobacteriaceae bacterium]|nr:SDR family NAD(P)-dependent oxidoreductase [Methylobacteriaceae bacterium]